MSSEADSIRISVVIPAYNIEKYLPRCLESLLMQSHRNLEILVIDDGSSDGTLEAARAAARKDSRIRLIHQENSGVLKARLAGVMESSGEWIGFVDGDDFVAPEMFERLLCNALAEGADISCCGYQKLFPDHTDYYYGTGKKRKTDGRESVKGLIAGDVEPGLCNKLYRASIVKHAAEAGHFDREVKIYEDFLLNFYLFSSVEQVVSEDLCLYNYVYRPGSATHPKYLDHKYRDPVKVWQQLLMETAGDAELYGICLDKLAQQLTRAAAITEDEEKTRLKNPFRREAREMLSRMLPELLANRYCARKTKALALLVLYAPPLYRWLKKTVKGS